MMNMTTNDVPYSSFASAEFGSQISATLHRLLQDPVLLPAQHVRENVLPTVLTTIVVVTGVYWAAFSWVAHRLLMATSGKALGDQRRLAYQITNCVTNTFLRLVGLYFQYFVVLPHYASSSAGTSGMSGGVEGKIQGHDDLYVLGSVQIGFQIWSIVMGLWVVEESTQMLIHHVAVIFASSKSVFLTNGFRYYAPLALGMTELSSVPLSVMNSFKNNEAWRDQYPQYYLASRLIFSIMFLGIRIGLFVPQHVEYLKLSGLVTYLAGSDERLVGYQVFMAISWLGAAFLLALQLLWGYLIVKGISNLVLSNVRIEKHDSLGKKTN